MKNYNILLNDRKIGTTSLEKADAPMGVVFGEIKFDNILSGYDFLKTYCLTNGIRIITDYPDEKLIITSCIPGIKVISDNGVVIEGEGTNIEGMDSDVFEVIIVGVPHPFFGLEFPHHLKPYDKELEED